MNCTNAEGEESLYQFILVTEHNKLNEKVPVSQVFLKAFNIFFKTCVRLSKERDLTVLNNKLKIISANIRTGLSSSSGNNEGEGESENNRAKKRSSKIRTFTCC